jgi:hypothetical protein
MTPIKIILKYAEFEPTLVYCDPVDFSKDTQFRLSELDMLSDLFDMDLGYVFVALKPLDYYKDVNSKQMNDLNVDILDQIKISEFANGLIGFGALTVSAYEIMLENHIDIYRLLDQRKAFNYHKLSIVSQKTQLT